MEYLPPDLERVAQNVVKIIRNRNGGITKVFASTHYSMGFILTDHNEIVYREDSLDHSQRSLICTRVNRITLPNAEEPAPKERESKTCGHCRYWNAPSWLRDEMNGVSVGYCTHPMVIQPNYGERNNREMRADGVWTSDEGGGTGELTTGPDFGCIHFMTRHTVEGEVALNE